MSATPLNPLGQLIILSAPSGGGKTTIAGELLRLDPTLRRSISVTTRAKRPDEVEGKDYFFISQAEFDRRLADNELLEHTRIHSNHYATPADYIMQQIQQGNSVLLVIESLGMRQIRLRDDLKPYLTSIFLLPVSMQELHDRLASRPKADPQENRRRLDNAYQEISFYNEYDYVIVNRTILDSTAFAYDIILGQDKSEQRPTNPDIQAHVAALIQQMV
jgi:guanylate kinase